LTLQRRLVAAFGAGALAPIVTVIVQLINVPVMLRCWGAHLYGEWLMISAIPAYLLLTDLGFGNVAGSDMTMRVHAGDNEGAIETFQSITALVLSASVMLGALLSAAIFLLPVHRLLSLSSMSTKETQVALLFLCANCLVVLQWNYINAGYRSAGRYSTALLIVNAVRILEGISFLVLLVWHAGPVQLSILMLGISILGTCWLLYVKHLLVPWLPLGIQHAKLARIRELTLPAVAHMAFPAGNALSLQGMTMMAGIVLGPSAVAVFNPMRTLSRTVSQLTDAVRISALVELSAVYGQKNWDLARKLHRSACQASLLLALMTSAALAISGPWIFTHWTHGRVIMNVPAFYTLLLVVLWNSVWNVSSAVPLAANRHQQIAIMYLICTSLSLFFAYPLALHFGIRGLGTALLLCEAMMCFYVIRRSNKMLSDRWPAFAASMMDTTQLRALCAKSTRRLV
jgi:O-antigen/teichoic acid export membrane protein